MRECTIGLYCLYTGCFQASSKRFAHVGAERQTNMHTYIHTCIQMHTFCVKQFRETRRVPGLKRIAKKNNR